jgi:hypothetical protein
MIKRISIISLLILTAFIIAGCHVAQEKAWTNAMESVNKQIAENPELSKNIARVELERRQFVRVYINPQKVRTNFQKYTLEVGEIAGKALFADPGNTMKQITIFGNLVDGDELIVANYTKEKGIVLEKDRSMLGM